ncbi:hypothetical protein [Aliiroseovarius sp. F47248L]|uniref:DUF7507 domain-containing protein n=1 Tax=Aliiroseovarius sp. F47248L TaxID=2926420 RepID=UPI001FF4DEB3|nr:hypothetical protein [Aliiroseovarius sp. F47248L]MCK0139919.1 hypothetical protein [Aliiroseovarius sp. F47248L]
MNESRDRQTSNRLGPVIRAAAAIKTALLAIFMVASFAGEADASDFTLTSVPNNFTAILEDGNGNSITVTVSPQNTSCASISGAGRITLFPSQFNSACNRSAIMTYTTNGFLLDRAIFEDIDDMDGTAPRDSFAANVPGTWTSPTIEIYPLVGPRPPWLSAADDQRGRLIASGAVGSFLANASGNNPTNESATFTLDTPATSFSIIMDDVQGARNARVQFSLASITVDISPELTLEKVVDNSLGGSAVPGDFTLSYTNGSTASGSGVTGSAAVTDVTVPVGTYTISETDDPNYALTATCSGGADSNPLDGLALGDAEDVTCVLTNTFVPAPELEVTKTVPATNLSNPPSVGDTIAYQVVVENTGNVDISGVAPVDTGPTFNGSAHAGADLIWVAGGSTTLAPGDTTTYTATYTLVAADVAALTSAADPTNAIANSATATGTPANGTLPPVTPSTATTGYSAAPGLSVAKSVPATNLSTPPTAGDTINYQVVITNSGNVDVSGVAPVDTGPTFDGAAHAGADLSWTTGDSTTLAPGASATFTATYTLVAADVTALTGAADPTNAIANSASATGTPTSGSLPPVTPSTATTGYAAAPGMSVAKSVAATNLSTPPVAGDTIEYEVVVTNTGNVNIDGATPVDTGPTFDGNAHAGTDLFWFTVGSTTLVPGEAKTYFATYTLVAADVAALTSAADPTNAIANSATGTGTPTSGSLPPVTPSTATTGYAAAPGLSVAKSVPATNLSNPPLIGDTIDYQVIVTNSGNVDITGVAPVDTGPTFDGNAHAGADLVWTTSDSTTLAPAGTATFTATYTLVAADVVALTTAADTATAIANSATATGTPVSGSLPPVTPGTATTGYTAAPGINVEKTADTSGFSTPVTAGDQIVFTIQVANTGNTALTNVSLNDSLTRRDGATLTLSVPGTPSSGDGGVPGTLDIGETWEYQATYTLVQDDINAGGVENTVTGTADVPGGGTVSDVSDDGDDGDGNTTDDPTEVYIAATPTITLAKSLAAGSPNPFDTVGQVLAYEFLVTNTGNVSITAPVTIDDPLIAGQGTGPVSCPTGPILPTASITCTGSYQVTQDDLNAGQVVNAATASVTQPVVPVTPGGPTSVTATDGPSGVTVPADTTPSISFGKALAPTSALTYAAVGDQLTYEFTVTNDGNITLDGPFTVDDDQIGNGLACGTGPLLPGANVTCTHVWTAAQEDLDAGSVTNIASAATTQGGSPVQSPTDTLTVNASTSPALTVDKTLLSATPDVFDEGTVLSYQFEVTNTGNVTIDGPITITDNKATGITCAPLTNGELLPTENVICTGSYTMVAGDVGFGSVTNVATATGDYNGTPVTSPSDDAIYPVSATPAISLTKDSDPTDVTFAAAGDVITYSYEITNGPTVALSEDISIDDDKIGAPFVCYDASVSGVFGVNETATCTAQYTVTQADVDAGEVTNIAVGSTTFAPGTPDETLVLSGQATKTVPADTDPSLSIAKTISNGPQPAAAGDVIEFTITATNDGNQTIANAAVSDPDVAALTCTHLGSTVTGPVTLLPTETITCVGDYTVTQGDIDAQSKINIANVSGTDPTGATVSVDGQVTVALVDNTAALELEKTVTPAVAPGTPVFTQAGDTVTFSVLARNTGNVSLENVVITDDLPVTPTSCAVGDLAVGQALTLCTFTYTVTQDDVDAVNGAAPTYGGFTNIARATANDVTPDATPITAQDDVFVRGPDQAPSFSLAKSADAAQIASVGQVVNYSYLVTNTGNITLTALPVVADDKIASVTCPALPGGELAPGDELTCTGSYTVTQADLNAGSLTNIARVSSPEVPLPASPGPETDTVTLPANRTASVDFTKTASITSGAAVGDVITYTYSATNTGNVTLTDVAVSDQHTSAAGTVALSVGGDAIDTDVAPSGDSTDAAANGSWDTLAPGDSITFTASYTVTQADVNQQGSLDNTARLTATPPAGLPPVDETDGLSIPVTAPTPGITALKTLATGGLSSPPVAGETLDYTITVTNSGNQDLSNISLIDVFQRLDGSTITPAAPPQYVSGDVGTANVLDVGEAWTYSFQHVLTQADIDAGGVSNQATARGQSPSNALVSDASDDGNPANGDDNPTVLPIAVTPGIEGQKTLSSGSGVLGSQLVFLIEVTNTGNVTLTSTGIQSDTLTRVDGTPLTPSAASFVGSTQGSGAGTLLPGEVASYEVRYTLIQEDIDGGGVRNSATVTGTPPSGVPITDVSDDGDDGDGNTTNDPTEVLITPTPALSMVKTVGAGSSNPYDTVGQQINYDFVVTNDGNVTLTDPITIADDLIDGAGGSVTCDPLPAGGLIPTATLNCAGSYTVTQDDIDNGSVTNTATASSGATTSAPDSVTVPAGQTDALTLLKVADPVPGPEFFVGATATYTYTLTNTGNTTQVGPFSIDDNLVDAGDITCPVPAGNELAPGDDLVCTGTYTVTATDVDLGSVTNLATGSSSTTTSPLTSETIPDQGVAALSIDKQLVAGPDFSEVGDVIGYQFIVTNSGTRTLIDPIIVRDSILGDITCWTPTPPSDPDFQAGEEAICVGDYVVTQPDLDRGFVFNEAYAETTYGPGDTPVVSPPDSVTVDGDLVPDLTLTKAAATLPVTAVGQSLTYTLIAENTGNQTLTNVSISDPFVPGLPCSTATLARGTTLQCTFPYTVTQADIDSGTLSNRADVTAQNPQGAPVTTFATLDIPMPAAAPVMELAKVATPSPFGAAGSTLTYQLSVNNTGNVTLSNVEVSDPMGGGQICTIASIAPGDTTGGCSFDVTVTQDMVDAGEVVNNASATATDPSNTPVNDTVELTTPGPARGPALEATKVVLGGQSVVGGLVDYSLSIANTGNVTLRNVNVVDQMQSLQGAVTALDAPFALDPASDTDSDGELDVGEVWTYTASVTLRQIDLNHAGLSNQVTVTADGPAGSGQATDVSDDGDDSDGNTVDDPTIFDVVVDPQLTVVKAVLTPGTRAGDQVVFEITATNTGNQDLTDLSASDTLLRADGTPIPATATPLSVPATLSPTEDAVWRVTHTLTQADVDAGGLRNSAVVSGLSPDNSPVSDLSADDDPLDGNNTDDPTEMLIAPAPGMEVIKREVSAGTAAGESVVYEVTVENTGNVTLTGIALADQLTAIDGTDPRALTPVFTGADGTPPSPAGTLLPGETATYDVSHVLTQDDVNKGGVINVITASAATPLGGSTSDVSDDDGVGTDDPTVTPIAAAPALDVTKTAGAPSRLFHTVEQSTFTITVTNTGNITQTGIQVEDDLVTFLAPATLLSADYPVTTTAADFTNGAASATFDGVGDTALLSGDPTLEPGETGTITITMVYSTANGFPTAPNTASATSTQLTTPSIGQGPLTPNDNDGDGIPDYQDFDPTGYFYCEQDGSVLTGGQVSISGGGFTQTGVGTNGPIVVTDDGSDGFYQFFVTAPGTYTLAVTYPPIGTPSTTRSPGGTLDMTTLLPANPAFIGSGTTADGLTLTDYSAGGNPFYFTFDIEAGDPEVQNNNIPLMDCRPSVPLVATKAADRDTAVFGETVNFTLTFENLSGATFRDTRLVDELPPGLLYTPGTARVNGTALEPNVTGRQLRWIETLSASEKVTITFAARIASRGNFGTLTNRTWAQDANGNVLSNVAMADIEIRPEHVFDCSDVIGKVFDDKNRNGYQDGPGTLPEAILDDNIYDGSKGKLAPTIERPNTTELGLPDVRLVSPNGTIITTDDYGRFSVPCAALPRTIGSNFMLKLDKRSLPTGYRVTTENPRVIRLTPGKIAKLNFGAAIGNVVDIDLTRAAFANGTTQPSTGLAQALSALVNQISDKETAIELTYVLDAGEDAATGRARLRAIKQVLERQWHGNYRLDVGTNVVRKQ